jgi:hypothetical protein
MQQKGRYLSLQSIGCKMQAMQQQTPGKERIEHV